eukprot:366292-Chlamydomonas_euryale.AAC.1
MLSEYARMTDNHEIAVDCLWRLSDWQSLKDTLNNKAQVRARVLVPGREGGWPSGQEGQTRAGRLSDWQDMLNDKGAGSSCGAAVFWRGRGGQGNGSKVRQLVANGSAKRRQRREGTANDQARVHAGCLRPRGGGIRRRRGSVAVD